MSGILRRARRVLRQNQQDQIEAGISPSGLYFQVSGREIVHYEHPAYVTVEEERFYDFFLDRFGDLEEI